MLMYVQDLLYLMLSRCWHSLTTAEWISLSSSSFYLLFCLILIQFLIKNTFSNAQDQIQVTLLYITYEEGNKPPPPQPGPIYTKVKK